MALIVVVTGVCAAFMAGPGIPHHELYVRPQL